MKRIILLLLFLGAFFLILSGQSRTVGGVKVTEEASIYEAVTVDKENFEGYRVQVFSGSSQEREKALKIKESIENTYNVKAYVDYEPPTFKVRVGDFIERLEAVPLKYLLKKEYPQCYIVKTKKVNVIDTDTEENIEEEYEN